MELVHKHRNLHCLAQVEREKRETPTIEIGAKFILYNERD
jgi:hypothetical protein